MAIPIVDLEPAETTIGCSMNLCGEADAINSRAERQKKLQSPLADHRVRLAN